MSNGETPTVSDTTLRKARRQHHCCECPAPIEKGEMYEVTTGLWECRWLEFKTCMPCAEFRQQFLEDLNRNCGWFETTTFGHLQAETSEFYG